MAAREQVGVRQRPPINQEAMDKVRTAQKGRAEVEITWVNSDGQLMQGIGVIEVVRDFENLRVALGAIRKTIPFLSPIRAIRSIELVENGSHIFFNPNVTTNFAAIVKIPESFAQLRAESFGKAVVAELEEKAAAQAKAGMAHRALAAVKRQFMPDGKS